MIESTSAFCSGSPVPEKLHGYSKKVVTLGIVIRTFNESFVGWWKNFATLKDKNFGNFKNRFKFMAPNSLLE